LVIKKQRKRKKKYINNQINIDMKKTAILLINLLFIGFIQQAYADYPIVGYSYLADPGAFVYNGRVYVYCSNDNENPDDGESYEMSSIVCVSSSDLKNWTNHGIVFDVPQDASWSNLSWAPSPAYKNGKFYLYFGNGGSAIGVAVSDSPTGPFVDPVGSSIANGSTPGVQPFDGWLFDPMTFVDDDGQAYMYFGGNGEDNLRVARLNEDMISINGSCEQFTVPYFFEAAWVHKYNGTYYFSYSTNPDNGMRIDYLTSNNPMSGFTYGGIMSPQPPVNNNNNHQAVIEIDGNWYQIYHNRIVAQENNVGMPYHRNLAIDAFSHNTDGSIQQMANTVDGVQQIRYLDPFIRQEAETMSNQSGIDVEVCNAGGMNLSFIDNGDWIMVEGVDFGSAGASSFSASVGSPTGGTIEIRLGSPTGTLAGTIQVPNTGGYQNWQTETTSLNQITGVNNVYFVFSTGGFNFDHWMFYSSGPIVSLTSPTGSEELSIGDVITIAANATPQAGSVTQVEFFVDGQSVGTDNSAPYSTTYTITEAGEQTISAVATDSQNDQGTVEITINVQGPYSGTAAQIPGTIEFENFDVGGNGFAYYDVDAGTQVDPAPDFRTDEDVDIENCTDDGGGYNIGFAMAGEWLEYTVDVQTAGTYNITFRAACDGDNKTISLDSDGTMLAENVAIPNTGGWQTWTDVTVEDVELQAGKQILRLTIGDNDYINLNYVTFTPVSVGPTVSITSPANNSEFDASQIITISATASSEASSIANVKFYAETNLLSTDDTAPYTFDWSGMTAGTYELSATATDTEGITHTETISVTVTPAPIVLHLKAGWNVIGFPYTESEAVETALNTIWDQVEVIKDFNGFYDKSQNQALNSLTTLEWGKGYFIKVNSACDLPWDVK
jgi:arabinoxylan arabinofuranohydrolase